MTVGSKLTGFRHHRSDQHGRDLARRAREAEAAWTAERTAIAKAKVWRHAKRKRHAGDDAAREALA